MKMRETEKRVAELTKEKQTLQNQLKEEQTARQKDQHNLQTSEVRVVELRNQLKADHVQVLQLQNQLNMEKTTREKEKERNDRLQNDLTRERAARQKEKEEAGKERNELKKKMEEMAAMLQTLQPKAKDGAAEGRKETEHQIVRQQAEGAEERVVTTRNGADAIVRYDSDGGPNHTLFSFSFGNVVARFTFTFRRIASHNYFGIVADSKIGRLCKGGHFTYLLGGAGWDVFERCRDALQNGKDYSEGSACAAGKEGPRVVLEADGRDGKRTLRLSQDGQTQPTFFSSIPVPFRFAIILGGSNRDSVSIDSVEELTEPTLTGGTTEIRMDECNTKRSRTCLNRS
ncbi:hypothetical protein BLNAU_20808 [Blattamonas nauphoetae]|uniref:Uncharacterized protein n=1 Tax=Blattamonas nauphoetae TaxID=2049346 RepID=A0ABQ9WXN2_9EUKA|nr:hypothetical protein BLNAU_20808 [Blattamonas nauphoetae]